MNTVIIQTSCIYNILYSTADLNHHVYKLAQRCNNKINRFIIEFLGYKIGNLSKYTLGNGVIAREAIGDTTGETTGETTV